MSGVVQSKFLAYGICFLVGLVIGTLTTCLFHYGVVFVGAVAGYAISMLIIQEFLLTNRVLCITLNIVFSLAGSLLISYFERPFVLIITTGFGAYVLVFGVDLVINRGIAYDVINDAKPSIGSFVEYVVIFFLSLYGLRRQSVRHTGKFGEHRYPPRDLSKETSRPMQRV